MSNPSQVLKDLTRWFMERRYTLHVNIAHDMQKEIFYWSTHLKGIRVQIRYYSQGKYAAVYFKHSEVGPILRDWPSLELMTETIYQQLASHTDVTNRQMPEGALMPAHGGYHRVKILEVTPTQTKVFDDVIQEEVTAFTANLIPVEPWQLHVPIMICGEFSHFIIDSMNQRPMTSEEMVIKDDPVTKDGYILGQFIQNKTTCPDTNAVKILQLLGSDKI
jgi:hypothetical protein